MLEIFKKIFTKKQEEEQLSIEEKLEEAFNSLKVDVIRLEIGSDLLNFTDEIMEEISNFRDKMKDESGFILPEVHVLDSEELQENEILIKIRGKYTVNDFVVPNEENIRKSINENLNRVCDEYIDEVFSIELVEKYITQVQKNNCWLVWCITKQLGTHEIKTILVNLIKNKKSINDINYIFEKIDSCLAEDRDCLRTWKPEVVSRRICKEI